ncbi:glycosyltransferase [Alienimonas californiensis]
MPCYNAARYLPAAAGSVLSQTLTDFEVVAVDDGSTDGTKALLDGYAAKDPRVRVISRPNTGIVGALNDGLEQCRAPLVARMDADDVCHPDRLRRQVAFLRDNPECVAVGTAVEVIDEDGAPVGRMIRGGAHAAVVARLLCESAESAQPIHPSVVMRTDAVLAVGGYRKEALWIEDYDLWLRLTALGEIRNMPEALLKYRVHGGSVSAERRELQVEKVRRLVAAARIARGLRADPPYPYRVGARGTAATYRGYVAFALREGRARTAWKYLRRIPRRRFGRVWWLKSAAACGLCPLRWLCPPVATEVSR